MSGIQTTLYLSASERRYLLKRGMGDMNEGVKNIVAACMEDEPVILTQREYRMLHRRFRLRRKRNTK